MLNNNFMHWKFPWNFSNFKTALDKTGLNEFQFTHLFYDSGILSPYFKMLQPLLDRIKPKNLYKIKANLNVYNSALKEYAPHIDIENFKGTTAIYYLNTNNGYTKIKKKKIMSEANKIVFFDSTQKHQGTNCTDCNYRIVLNFNYEDNEF